ncbi:MAG: polysaccharide deacetylase family protein, partial [bacterium]|nr:polysaccharide deacetylase family protein [bacterium]
MNSYFSKVRIYVVLLIVAIIVVSKFVSDGLRNNVYFTPEFAFRTISAMRYKKEFLKSPAAATTTALSTELDFKKSVPVLVYHGILENAELEKSGHGSEGDGISVKNFKEHMFMLKNQGYTTITSDELGTFLKTGTVLPEKPIMITFDDGRIDSFKYSDPILEAVDFEAVMFIIGKFGVMERDQPYYLSTKHIKEMERSGRWDIQAHSYDGHNSYFTSAETKDGHFFSHKIWLEGENRLESDAQFALRVSNDLQHIQNTLEKMLDKKIKTFAYPFGDFGQNSTNYAQARSVNITEAAKIYDMVFYQADPNYRYTQNYFNASQA